MREQPRHIAQRLKGCSERELKKASMEEAYRSWVEYLVLIYWPELERRQRIRDQALARRTWEERVEQMRSKQA